MSWIQGGYRQKIFAYTPLKRMPDGVGEFAGVINAVNFSSPSCQRREAQFRA